MDLFDHKPQLDEAARQGAARLGPQGPAAHRHDRRPGDASRSRRRIFKFAQHGQSGAVAQRAAAAHRRGSSTTSASSVDAHRGDQPRPGHHVLPDRHRSSPAGRASGSWLSYGLGSENHDLPAFVVLISHGTRPTDDQPLYDRLWGSGFLPSQHQGVKFRSGGDPVLYLSNPAGVDRATPPRACSTTSAELNQLQHDDDRRPGDRHAHRAVRAGLPHADARARADRPVERAASTSSSCTAPTSRKPGTFAANCLLARRLAERGVRFVQLYHRGWDQHGNLPEQIRGQCRDTDQPSAALVTDLKQRGLLDDTLVDLGRRVRPDRLLPGQADRRQLRPRPPPALLHHLAGRRRHQAGHHLRRDRRLRLQHRRGPGPRPRPARDDPALPGHRPHAADLQVPGPGLPADRRARQRGEGDPGVGVYGAPRQLWPNRRQTRTASTPTRSSIGKTGLDIHRRGTKGGAATGAATGRPVYLLTRLGFQPSLPNLPSGPYCTAPRIVSPRTSPW